MILILIIENERLPIPLYIRKFYYLSLIWQVIYSKIWIIKKFYDFKKSYRKNGINYQNSLYLNIKVENSGT